MRSYFSENQAPLDINCHLAEISRQLDSEMPRALVSGMKQKELSFKIDSKNLKLLQEETSSIRDRARLSSLSIAHSGDWLNTIPSAALGLHLKGLEFQYMARYRLGIPVYDSNGPCPSCAQRSDEMGD